MDTPSPRLFGLSKIQWVVGLVIIGAVVFGMTRVAGSQKTLTLRWLIAHEPVHVFDRASEVFVDDFQKATGGHLDLTVKKPSDFGADKKFVPTAEALAMLDRGEVDVVSMDIARTVEATDAFYVLNLPFMLKNYQSAEKIYEGEVGKTMLGILNANISHRALAFTYSGGFKNLLSTTKPIRSADDLVGLRVGTWGGLIAEEYLSSMGAKPIRILRGAERQMLEDGEVDAVEETDSRVDDAYSPKAKYLNETKHGMFLTVTVVRKAYYDALSTEEQSAIEKAAHHAAQIERADTIAYSDTVRAKLANAGVTLVTLTPEEAAAFEARSKATYTKFVATFGTELIQAIENAIK